MEFGWEGYKWRYGGAIVPMLILETKLIFSLLNTQTIDAGLLFCRWCYVFFFLFEKTLLAVLSPPKLSQISTILET